MRGQSIYETIRDVKEIHDDDTRFIRVHNGLIDVFLNALSDPKFEKFVMDADDDSHQQIKCSKRYQFVIDKYIYYNRRRRATIVKFIFIALDNIDDRLNYDIASIEMDKFGWYILDNFVNEENIKIYETLLDEYNKGKK